MGGIDFGGGDEAGDDAGTQRGVVFAERVFDGDTGAAAECVGQLRSGDEAQGLSLKEAATCQGLAQSHAEVVGTVGGLA